MPQRNLQMNSGKSTFCYKFLKNLVQPGHNMCCCPLRNSKVCWAIKEIPASLHERQSPSKLSNFLTMPFSLVFPDTSVAFNEFCYCWSSALQTTSRNEILEPRLRISSPEGPFRHEPLRTYANIVCVRFCFRRWHFNKHCTCERIVRRASNQSIA
jgi:hypothetical protein